MNNFWKRLAYWFLSVPCLCTNLRAFSDGHMDEQPNKFVDLHIFTAHQDWYYDTVLEKLKDTEFNVNISFCDDDSGIVFYFDWNLLGIWSGMYYTH